MPGPCWDQRIRRSNRGLQTEDVDPRPMVVLRKTAHFSPTSVNLSRMKHPQNTGGLYPIAKVRAKVTTGYHPVGFGRNMNRHVDYLEKPTPHTKMTL